MFIVTRVMEGKVEDVLEERREVVASSEVGERLARTPPALLDAVEVAERANERVLERKRVRVCR